MTVATDWHISLFSSEAGPNLFLTSLLPLGVWLLDSCAAPRSFLTLSLYSSVIQNTHSLSVSPRQRQFTTNEKAHLIITCPILAGKRGLRGPIGQVRWLGFLGTRRSRNLAAPTICLRLRRLRLLWLIFSWCLQITSSPDFAARLFRVLVYRNMPKKTECS